MIKIIFLLFALINSKLEFTPHLGNLKVLLDNSYVSESLDETIYCTAETKDQCLAESIPDTTYQCCYDEIVLSEGTMGQCTKFFKDLKDIKNLYESKPFKANLKEILGYQTYAKNGGQIARDEENIICSNGQISSAEDGEFNENEQKKLKNENHCLKKRELKFTDFSYDVGKCEEGLLTDNAKKSGLECGYMLYQIKINSEKTISFKACTPFNFEFYSKFAKLDQDNFVETAKMISTNYEYENYESFTVEFYNTKGQKVKYDSKTNKIIIENAGNILSASIYLFLLILILF